MVAAVRYFWQKPVTCNARSLLYAAQTSLERGFKAEAGCQLREAMRAYLHSQCSFRDCLPKQKRPPSARVLALSLRKKGFYSDFTYEWICEMIDVGNKAVHLVEVKPSTIIRTITIFHEFLDEAPYLVECKKGGRS